ncbi:MAG: lipid-binding SYLF domain-containing protein [Candidatus Krumholzibacteriia bacterium]
MHRRATAAALAVGIFVATAWSPAPAGEDESKRVAAATAVLDELMGIPEKGVPGWLLKEAHGIAVIPGVIKAGFVVGGRRGHGVLVVRDGKSGWSRPVFVTLTGGSIGWQIGAQSTDVILVLKSKRSVDGILKGKFTLGGNASVAAGPVGRHAEAGTDVQLKAEIYSYSRSRGLFAGLSLEGAKLGIKKDANASFYGSDRLTAGDILENRKLETPAPARAFVETLEKYIEAAAKAE